MPASKRDGAMLRTEPHGRQPGQVLRDVGPGLAVVAGQLHQAVVGAGPDEAALPRRLGDAVDDAGVLDADVVRGETAGAAHPRAVVQRQVRTDDLPALPAVGRAVHVLAADVDGVAVVRRDLERRIPHEAVAQAVGRAVRLVRPHLDVAELAPVSLRTARRCRRPCPTRRPSTRRCWSPWDPASPSRFRRRRPRATSRAGCRGRRRSRRADGCCSGRDRWARPACCRARCRESRCRR